MRNLKPFLGNNKGFNLVGVLAGAGILSIVIVGVMTVSNNIMQTMRTADVKASVQEDLFLAQALLATESNCTVNFKGLTIDATERTFNANGGKLYLSTAPGVYTLSKSLIFPGQNSKSTLAAVKKIEYRLFPGSTNVMTMNLSFEPRGSIVGGSLREREIPLQVSVKNNKIESCVALGFKNTDVTDDPDVDDPKTQRDQGRACSGVPPGGGGASAAGVKDAIKSICKLQTYPVTSKGLKIPLKESRECWQQIYQQRRPSAECKGLRALYLSETVSTAFNLGSQGGGQMDSRQEVPDSDIYLKSRNGYKSEAECLKQAAFSEGDNFVSERLDPAATCNWGSEHNDNAQMKCAGEYLSFICVNGRWTR